MKKIYKDAEIKIVKFEFENTMDVQMVEGSAPDKEHSVDSHKSIYEQNGVNP